MSAKQPEAQGSAGDSRGGSGDAHDRFSAKYVAYDSAVEVVEKEAEYLKWWRGREQPLVGLALSGGGIRSATYCLGVLQALAHDDVLPQVDYLSTVSGGGYIGASLTYLLHQSAMGAPEMPKFDVSQENFPYVSYPMVGVGELEPARAGEAPAPAGRKKPTGRPEADGGAAEQEFEKLKGRLLRRLRQSTNYLVPGDGITVLSLAGVVVRNLAASLAVHVALLVILFQLLFWSTWSDLDKLPEGASSQRGSVASVWAGVGPKARTTPVGTPSAAASIAPATPEARSILSAAPAASTTAPGTAPANGMAFIPAANGFLRLAGCLFAAFGLVSAVYLVATRFFDSMERQPDEPTGRRFGPYGTRRLYERATHWLLLVVIALLVIGGIPWAQAFLVENSLVSQLPKLLAAGGPGPSSGSGTGIVATLIGVVGNVWAFLQARSTRKPLIPTGLIVAIASAALFFGLLLLVYILTGWLHLLVTANAVAWIAAGAGLVLLLIGWLPEANYASLHRFYRDRLLELFLPDLKAMQENMMQETRYLPLHLFLWSRFKRACSAFRSAHWGHQPPPEHTVYARIGRSIPGDATMLADVCGGKLFRERQKAADSDSKVAIDETSESDRDGLMKRGPYHIVNAHLVLVASQDPRYRPRGGDNFIFSPLHCGSRATGWTSTESSPRSGPTLATAMAISGAAVNPNAGPDGRGITRQPVLSVLMGLLNLRLGYWVRNPRLAQATGSGGSSPAATPGERADGSESRVWMKPNAIYPGLLESFGRFNLNEQARYLLLTDGGHFENLGLYELVRRRLKLIIVCDATADPSFKFTDLSNAIQKVRADFGAIIDVSAEQLATLAPPPHDAAARDGAGKGDAGSAESKAGAAGPPLAAKGHLIIPIRYSKRLWPRSADAGEMEMPPADSDDRNETGTLILLKATACHGLSADLFSYRRDHPEFPNEGTVDQFFDERQFDAYRELGFNTAFQMLTELADESRDPPVARASRDGYVAQTRRQVASLLSGRSKPPPAGDSVTDPLGW
jgi:hypothetical protein